MVRSLAGSLSTRAGVNGAGRFALRDAGCVERMGDDKLIGVLVIYCGAGEGLHLSISFFSFCSSHTLSQTSFSCMTMVTFLHITYA